MNFDMKAIDWDNEPRIKRAQLIAEEIKKSIPIKKYNRALEFGCGTGLISFNLAENFEAITLVDISSGMIDVLNKKIIDFNMKNMNAIQLDINNGNGIRDKYDTIYTSMAMHHVVDIETTLRNLYNLLNKDGYICIVDLLEDDGSFHKAEKDFNGHNGFNQEKLAETLREVGYKDIESKVFFSDVRVIEEKDVNYSLFIMTGKNKE